MVRIGSVLVGLVLLAGCGGEEARVEASATVSSAPMSAQDLSGSVAGQAESKAASRGGTGRLAVCVRNTNAAVDDTISVSGPANHQASIYSEQKSGDCRAWTVPAGLYRVHVTRDRTSCAADRLTVRRDRRQELSEGGTPGAAESFLPYEAQVARGEAVELEVVTSCES